MQIQPTYKLSQRSKGILYQLKSALKSADILFHDYVTSIFGPSQKYFNRLQFQKLIQQNDKDLLLVEIDDLFEGLVDEELQSISRKDLMRILDGIGEDDNPLTVLESKKKKGGNKMGEIDLLIGIKNKLIATGDHLKTIDYFLKDQEGFMDRQNISELLTNLSVNDTNEIKKFIKILFQQKQQVHITDLLEVCGLQYLPMRVNQVDKKSLKKQIKSFQSTGNQKILNQGSIPQNLKSFFNYNSHLEAPFAFYAQKIIQNCSLYLDPDNPRCQRASDWVHAIDLFSQKFSLFQIASSVFHRQKKRNGIGMMIEPHDIRQGSVGDCYFLSGVASIANKYPQLLLKIFVFDKNPAHIYGVRLFIDGLWKTFVLDATFPIKANGKLLGAQPHHEQIWFLLLEKAWAKHFKSYDIIRSGFSAEGLNAISGAPNYVLNSNDKKILQKLKNFLKNGSVMTCASSRRLAKMTKEERQKMGILAKHSYTLLQVYFDVPFKNGKITLFKIRNPWGRYPWKGSWSFDCNNWTQKLRKLLNYEFNPEDGSFFVSFLDFKKIFGNIYVSCLKKNYLNSSAIIQSNRNDFHQTQIHIKTKGLYYFTIYQDSRRIYKNIMTYKKSKSWLFLTKVQKAKYLPITSRAQDFKNNTIEVVLEAGHYLLTSRVNWKYWNDHSYALTIYGPSEVKMSTPAKKNGECLKNFIEAKYKEIGKHIKYNQNLTYQTKYFSKKQGFGFICIKNQDCLIFKTNISLSPMKGLSILEPHNFPIELIVLPMQKVLIKFLVDPNGFNYKIKEKYIFSKGVKN